MEATIALGNIRYTHADKGILYIPTYLIKGDTVVEQIGVYEFLASQLTQLLDEDNDFDVTRLNNPLPLYYLFFNKIFLEKIIGKVLKKSNDEEGEEGEEGEADDGLESNEWSSPNDTTVLDEILGEELSRAEDSISEREAYIPNKRDTWVQK